MVIHASKHQEMYGKIRNQCCAISLASLAMVLLFKLDYTLVTTITLDAAYEAGNELYLEHFGDNKSKAAFDFDGKNFDLMGFNFIINASFQEYSGLLIQAHNPEVPDTMSLEDALIRFINEDHSLGILSSGGFSFGLSYSPKSGEFFLTDSHWCLPNGRRGTKSRENPGAAMRFRRLRHAVKFISRQISENVDKDSLRKVFYNLTPIALEFHQSKL